MQLIVGLGNPGDKYARNRHNIGFMAVDTIAARHNFPVFRQKFSGLVSEGTIDGERVLLLKPQTFMNVSGDSVVAAANFYKLTAADITVFYDEIDLVPGKVRVKLHVVPVKKPVIRPPSNPFSPPSAGVTPN